MKKILSLVLAALMVFSVVPAVFAAESTTAATTSDYQDAIDFLKLLDLYKGRANGDAADELVQRYEMAIFAARFKTGHTDGAYWATVENDSGFSDVTDFDGASAETLGAISYASQIGIINGVGGDKFDPSSNVTYRDAITMVMRALGYDLDYPWGYIEKATTLGVTAGIEGIGLTDKIAREVVAQLLYNALFIEVNGTTVAESVYKVGATVVMITASKNVTYTDNVKLADNATNKVRFAELNAQGEPLNSVTYHGNYSDFGIADVTEANAAVGTTYYVVYKNNFANILSAKSLNTVYTNNGVNDVNAKLSGSTLTIGGQNLTVVSEFSELNNEQGWLGNAKGEMGVKLYKSFGSSKKVAAGYMLASNGNVYRVVTTSSAATELEVYAYYSALLDAYYVIEGGKFVEKNLDDILYTSATTAAGFAQKTADTATKLELYQSAYAKFIATDSNMDGDYDRVTYRTYGFGQFKKSTISGKTYFAFDTAVTYNNALSSTTITTASTNVANYRWTGMDYSKVSNNALVLYYMDDDNKEVDILKVIDSSYQVTGYVRGIAKYAVSINIDGVDYAIGYDTLAGSPLKTNNYAPSEASFQKANANRYNNESIISGLINTYVTLTVIDGKVVMIDDATKTNDYIIIDSFVDFTENGIVANAYTTVTDEYTEITIASFNGWSVGTDVNYYLYYLAGMFGSTSSYVTLPVEKNTLYKVVSATNGVYDLTTVTPVTSNNTFTVNQYGYITSDYAIDGSKYYIQTSDSDYWLILDETAGKVYSYKGKLNTITLANMNVYKAASNDYVLVGDMSGVSSLPTFGTNIKYMMYNKYIADTANSNWWSSSSAYNYTISMTNVLTGAVEIVQVDPSLVTTGWTGTGFSVNLSEGTIYKVEGGKLTDATAVAASTVAAYYGATSDYAFCGSITRAGGFTSADICDYVASEMFTTLYGSWGSLAGSTFTTANLAKNVKVYYVADYGTTGYKYLTSTTKAGTAKTFETGSNWYVDYVIAKDGTAIAWVTLKDTAFATATLAYGSMTTSVAATYAKSGSTVTINVDLTADPISSADSVAITAVTGYTVEKIVESGAVTGLKLTGTTDVPATLTVTLTRDSATFTVTLVK